MSELKPAIEGYLRRALAEDADPAVAGFERFGTGSEAEMFAFELQFGPPARRRTKSLVLRLYPGFAAHARAAREFNCMKLLLDSGYPVPRVLLHAGEDSPLDSPFVLMERVRGEEMWAALHAADEAGQQRGLEIFAGLLARLHNLDWRPFASWAEGDAVAKPYVFVDRWLSEARAALTQLSPDGFRPLSEWLERQRDSMRCERPSVVHWDFHPGNVLLHADETAVVVDWGGLRVSDARFDLAWTLLLTELYGGVAWRERVLRVYERLTGSAVERLETFEAFACARRLLVIAAPLRARAVPLTSADAARVRREAEHVRRVYERLRRLTGVRVSEIEELSSRLP